MGGHTSMRIYEGAARRDYEEALRSIGATLDGYMLRESVILEVEDGFFVQGIGLDISDHRRSLGVAIPRKIELTFFDADIVQQVDSAAAAAARTTWLAAWRYRCVPWDGGWTKPPAPDCSSSNRPADSCFDLLPDRRPSSRTASPCSTPE